MASKSSRTPLHGNSTGKISRTVSECSNSTSENVCPICHENEAIYAVAACNHSICFKCSTRLRFLLRQFYCPICRADCAKVYFVHHPQDYQTIDSKEFILERKAKVWLEDQAIRDAFHQLLAHQCKFCPEVQTFKGFKELQNHVKREHQRFFCDICSANVKLFTSERKAYDRKDLALHKRKGDEDDKSFKGHPLCQICDNRFLDTDELWRHLRKDHFYCHFCDADGEHIYFGTYGDVRDHFRSDHYLCEEDECVNIQFTTAFRCELDLKAHKAQYHPKGSKRSQRQARTIEVNFSYGEPRRNPRDTRSGGARTNPEKSRSTIDQGDKSEQPNARSGSRFTQEDMDTAKAISASLNPSQVAPVIQNTTVDVASNDDFPTLPGDRLSVPALRRPVPNFSSHQALDDTNEYPSLSTSSSSTIPPERPVSRPNSKPASKPANKPSNQARSSAPAQAAVKAKSNPWSSTDDEFPTLEGSSSAKLHIHGWHIKKPEPKPVPKFINNSRPTINSEADFPTLGDNPGSSLSSLATWINTNRPGTSKTPAPAPEKAISSVSETAPAGVNTATPSSKKKKKKKAATTMDYSHEIEKEQISSTVAGSGQSERHELKNGKTSSDTVTTSKSKAGKVKTSKKLASLEVELSKDFPTFSPNSNSRNCADDEPLETAGDIKEDKDTSKDEVKTTLVGKVEMTPVGNAEETATVVLDPSDYPSLSSNKKQLKKPPGLSTGSDVSNRAALGLSRVTAPPGLVANKKKPPGLAIADLPPQPPSFNMASIATLLNQSDSSTDPFAQQSYIEPVNFTQRNKKLSFKLKELIYNNIEKFHKFKNFTIDFRSGLLSPSEFYQSCEVLLGVPVFLEILPELIALLPDISKQQKLHQLCADDIRMYQQSTQLWSSTSDTSLVVCQSCQQVVLSMDFSHHEASHGVEVDDFPNLAHSGLGNSSKPGRNAWAGV